ncbi:MAG: hypothetical protein ACLQVX_06615 [Limisphaerales bacterium]
MSAQEIEGEFPRLRQEGYVQSSPPTVPRSVDLESFIKLYEFEGGYAPCDNGVLEVGFQKIVIFLSPSKEVTHAAKQLPSGEWASKLGDLEDIHHKTLSGLEGGIYGNAAQFLKRRIRHENEVPGQQETRPPC